MARVTAVRSYSRLSTYLECPESYYWKYVQRVPEQPSIWSIGGTAFHTCAEQVMRGDEPDWDAAWQDAYTNVITRDPAAADLPLDQWRKANKGTEDAKWWGWHGPRMVDGFVTWRNSVGAQLQPLSDGDRLWLETRIEVELAGVPIVAIPDALVTDEHGQLNVLDYKTGKDQRGPGGSLQLGVYKAAVTVATGMEATWGLYYMARSKTLVPRDLTAWNVHNIGEMFSEFDAREKAGDYRPNPGKHCNYCPLKAAKCSYWQEKESI